MRQKSAFTLIELLVVVSIIALLSSIVLASLNSAREKGRIAAGRQFAAGMDHSESDYAVGMWEFDECSGAVALDRSGNGNDGTILNAPAWSTDTPSGRGCSLSFNGTNQVAVVNSSSSLNVSSAITLAAWVKLNSYTPGGPNTDHSNIVIRPSSYYMSVNPTGNLDAYLTTVTGGSYISSASVLPLNKWTFVAIVYDGSALKWYIDGTLDKSMAASGVIGNAVGNSAFIGGETVGYGRYINGYIDSPRIFAKALTAMEIGKLYAAGSARQKFARN